LYGVRIIKARKFSLGVNVGEMNFIKSEEDRYRKEIFESE
jgi:hypothetical protein